MDNYLLCINCGKKVPATQEQFPYCWKCKIVAKKLVDRFNQMTVEQQNDLLGIRDDG